MSSGSGIIVQGQLFAPSCEIGAPEGVLSAEVDLDLTAITYAFTAAERAI